ncbi:MAG: hypothetical protein ABIR30_09195 [Chitinophagaceae bacterium]
MANQLLLPPQKFKLTDITDQFPKTGTPKKKVFFQAELRSLANGDASFGVIAYPAWRDSGKWVIGTKVSGSDAGAAVAKPFVPPLAFANNEVVFSFSMSEKSGKAKGKKHKKDPRKGRWNDLMKLAKKVCKDKKNMKESLLHFETSVSENPHLEYNVTLEVDGVALSVSTKPSPPAPPEA